MYLLLQKNKIVKSIMDESDAQFFIEEDGTKVPTDSFRDADFVKVGNDEIPLDGLRVHRLLNLPEQRYILLTKFWEIIDSNMSLNELKDFLKENLTFELDTDYFSSTLIKELSPLQEESVSDYVDSLTESDLNVIYIKIKFLEKNTWRS